MREMSNYLTGAVIFKEGFVEELVVYCFDPVGPELEAVGYMEQNFVGKASKVIADIKEGDQFFALFRTSDKLYPLEIVVRDGRETLEIADVGQPDEFKKLRNLPLPGGG